MIRASGSAIGSRTRIGRSLIRQNETTGAPVRSEPKLGNACACLPPSKAATDRSSAAVTTPCPPLPCMRTWKMLPTLSRGDPPGYGVFPQPGVVRYSVGRRHRMVRAEDVDRVVVALHLAQPVVHVDRPHSTYVGAHLGEIEVLAAAVVAL